MRRIFTLLLITCSAVATLHAQQNANLEVRITRLERLPYADCLACGDPDPTWKVQVTHNGTGAVTYGPNCWHYPEMGFSLWDIPDYTLMNAVNINATTFTAGFADAFEKSCNNNTCTYQSYNFFTCFPSVYGDSRRCQNTNMVVQNFKTFAPCQWHTFWSPWCGDYRFEYSFRWSFNYVPTITTHPVASTNACIGTTVTLGVQTATDPNGWNMGQGYQWQVSNSTACPGSGWSNIFGANNATYTVPELGGTRLYRVIVTSNCTQDFTSNSTVSNCALVTYNPIGSPGDLVPDIVSGICGSTVLPGSTHVLGVVNAPTPGAVLGLTDYTWTASGGAPTTFNGPVLTWTAPVTPGTYNINLTYNDNCPQADATANTCVVTVGSATCDFAYVATYGVDSIYAGGPDNPYKTLNYAISQLNGRKYIRMATGTYNETAVLNLQNDLIIEGGYIVNGNIWTKSTADSTQIISSATEVINNDVAHRVAFVSNAANNWTLQDLVIRTTNVTSVTTNNKGYSNYGVLALNGSSGFQLVRCKVYAGSAAKGGNGTTPTGAGGAGGGGTGGSGGAGSTQGCNGQGTNGQSGTSGNGGAAAGIGGGGCGGGGCNIFGCNANGCTAAVGQPGTNGAAGQGYPVGNQPPAPAPVSPYYLPAGQAASGLNGFGGGGGGGGGGGDIGTCCTCSCGSGAPNGGNGGNGGGGGLPGSGGFGGGGSFGVYASGAGTSGSIVTSLLNAGAAGQGGDGALGQAGAVGANGNAGVNHGGCDGGTGGAGGKGGNGGQGGRGQDGANGLSQAIVAVGGATVTGSSTSVPSSPTVAINYQNTKACINSEIEMTKNTGVWGLPSGLNLVNDLRDYPAGFPVSSYSNASSPVLVTASTPSTSYTLTVNGVNYAQYLKIASDNRVLPTINPTSNVICINGIDTFTATSWGTEVEYDWRVYQGTSVNSPLYQSTLQSPVINFFGFQPGMYVVRYRVRETCCGWSKPVFDTLKIEPEPTIYNVTGGGNYCPGTNGATVGLSGSEPGVLYILMYNGNAVDSIIGNGGPLTFAAQQGVGNYSVNAIRFTGCDRYMFGSASIGQFPTPQVYLVSGTDTLCEYGTGTAATISVSGSELGVDYQLMLSGNIPQGAALPGSGGILQFTGITAPGVYYVEATSTVTGCSSMMDDSATVTIAPQIMPYNVTGGGPFCAGTAGSTIGLSNSEVGVSYQLLQGGVLPVGTAVAGTGSAITLATVNQTGFYKVKATNAGGCELFMLDSVTVTERPNPTITGVSHTDVLCNGQSTGSITIQAVSANGTVFFSIDSGANYSSNNVFTQLAAGNYPVFVKDTTGCETRYVVNPVVVTQPQPMIVAIESVDSVYCAGNSNGVIRISVYGGKVPYVFQWSNGSTFEDQNQLSAGTYTVTVTDANQCTATLTSTLTEPDQQVAVATVPVNVKCFNGSDGNVTIQATGGTPPFTYYMNGIIKNTNVFTGLSAGFYTVMVEDAHGCKATTNFTISQPNAITVNAGEDLVSIKGQPVQLNGSAYSITGIIGYLWSPDSTLSCADCQNPIATPVVTQHYVLMAVDRDSCVGYDTMEVVVKYKAEKFIPTAFTPNNDNLNDRFEFDVLGAVDAMVSVFNRWGERIYYNPSQPNGITNTNGWDGTKDGKRMPEDTYVYQITIRYFDSSEENVTGTITLMR
ncbi:MAG: gliding motility-associated C-terminal domain-containing protein [Chitinophagales bacterium]|nr:gliding motility-associated C-terminal domain-containing protein [Chitinophagales bacterium]